MMKTIKKIVTDPRKIFAILFGGGLLFLMLKECTGARHRINNAAWATGKVVDFTTDYRGNGSVDFEYSVGGQTYTGVTATPGFSASYGYLLEGNEFPVMYDSTNEKSAIMIIYPENFKAHGLIFPDSLKWINDYRRR